MKFNSFCLFLLLLTCTCDFSEGLWGSGKSDQQQAKDHTRKAAEDVKLSAQYARDAAAETAEAAKAQGRAFTGGAKQRASDYYDSAGSVIGNIRDYVGTVYDKTGNALGDAKDFAYEKAHDYYDSAGNLIGSIGSYVGTVYDRAGNALGDAKDFAFGSAEEAGHSVRDYYDCKGSLISNIRGFVGVVYDRAGNALGDAKDLVSETASNVGNVAGNKLHRAGGYFQQSREDRPCRRLLADSCACVKSSFVSVFSLLLSICAFLLSLWFPAALLVASYFIYTRLLGKRVNTEGLREQSRQLGEAIKAKAGIAREKVNDLGHKAKETIANKMPRRLNGRVAGSDSVDAHDEQSHEQSQVPVQHYSEDRWAANGHLERHEELIE